MHDTYNQAVDFAKEDIGTPYRWIFEDTTGHFHSLIMHGGTTDFNHYCGQGWIPRGKVVVEHKVITMFTGVNYEIV